MINYLTISIDLMRDERFARLSMDFKNYSGLGIYIRIIQEMAHNDGRLPNDNNLLGFMIGHVSAEDVKKIVNNYGLFTFSDDNRYFTCDSVQEDIQRYRLKSDKAKKMNEIRWGNNKDSSKTPQKNNKDSSKTPIRLEEIREDNNISISIKNDEDVCDSQPLLLPSPVAENATTDKAKEENKASKQEQLQLEADFDFFWKIYPRHVNKKDSFRAYCKARKKASADELLEALREVKSKEWRSKELQYIPHASTWLNQERWNDEVVEAKKIDPLDDLDLESNPFEVNK